MDEYRTLMAGHIVALALREPVANLSCYVGEVKSVDTLGVRIALADWILGAFTEREFFAPWSNIIGAMVSLRADEPDLDALARFQERSNEQPKNHD
jgi:hypothetical protein